MFFSTVKIGSDVQMIKFNEEGVPFFHVDAFYELWVQTSYKMIVEIEASFLNSKSICEI